MQHHRKVENRNPFFLIPELTSVITHEKSIPTFYKFPLEQGCLFPAGKNLSFFAAAAWNSKTELYFCDVVAKTSESPDACTRKNRSAQP